MDDLNKHQWSQLKDALLCAKYNEGSPSQEFDVLSDELKIHEIGACINSFLYQGNKEALGKAARLLAPETENYWVALERA